MQKKFFSRENSRTAYVQLDTGKCIACWKCLEVCQKQVIGKVDLPWHKHALIINPVKCSGCLNCIKICQYNAFSKIDRAKLETEKKRKRIFINFVINNLLLLSCIILIITGLTLQLGFHIGGDEEHNRGVDIVSSQPVQYEQSRDIDTSKIVNGLNYDDWSVAHKFGIVFFSLFVIYHIYSHYKWFRTVISKHLISKNIQLITLSVLILLVAITGFIPWFIDLLGSASILRLIFIEIHDKLALILVVYLILHFSRKYNWFSNTYSKLRG